MSHLCSTNLYTGLTGYVSLSVASGAAMTEPSRLGHVTKWELNIEKDPVVWNDSGAQGAKWSMATVNFATGQLSFLLYTTIPANTPARAIGVDNVDLILFVSPSFYITMNATFANVRFMVNIQTADIVGVEFTFLSNGAVRLTKI